jgi:hypothetical protein
MSGLIDSDSRFKVVRVPNYLVSIGINNGNWYSDPDEVDREPTQSEYTELCDATDAYFEQFFRTLCEKNNVKFIRLESKVNSKSYKKDMIPNDKFQVCLKYSHVDIYYSNDSDLTDEMEVSAEGICTCILLLS